MSLEVGVGLAFVAMLCWGVGDFFVQRSARKIGDWETLFVITIFGTAVLFPFVYKNLPHLFSSINELAILSAAGVILLISSVMDLEGFKRGKLSVLEPLLSLEIIAAALLAWFFLGDHITWLQTIVMATLIVSLILISFREKHLSKNFLLEKGVLMFIGGSTLMGLADFFMGWGSRVTDPLLTNFVINVIIAVVSFVAIVFRGRVLRLGRDLRQNPGSLLVMALTDNVAWIAYTVAMTLVPIAIATGLSESSIIIAVLLGLFINKEKLQFHQRVGLVGAIVSALMLALLTTQ